MNAAAQIVLTTDTLSALREDIQAVAGDKQFHLPEADAHVVGISSGNDSTATALVMAALFPHLDNLHYVFTDTGVEVEGTNEQIAKIEAITGRQVHRVTEGRDLFQIIEDQGNFLPSQRERFCTRMAKIRPLIGFFDDLKAKSGRDLSIASYVGIRADEPHREGGQYGDGGTTSYMPLQALGFTRADVYRLVDKWVGLPAYYLRKSRSGCAICIFSRRSEVLAQLEAPTETVTRAINMETLSDETRAKLSDLPPSVAEQVGVARNHLMFALPTGLLGGEGPQDSAIMPWEQFRAKVDTSNNGDLFDDGHKDIKRFFVAVEMRVGWMGFGAGHECYFQSYITHSTSLNGLKTALKFHWQHKLNTRELTGNSSEAALRDSTKIAIFEIALHDHDAHLGVDLDGVYTWQNDRQPLLLLRKTRHLLEQILLTEGLRQGLKDQRGFVRAESEQWLPRVTQEFGAVLWGQTYDAPSEADLEIDFDIEDAPVACNICSR